MKLLLVVTLILIGGFGTSSAMSDKCEAQDLNAMMVYLHQLRTEFKHFKENSSKEFNTLKQADDKKAMEIQSFKEIALEEFNTLKHADDEKAKEIQMLNATLLNKTSQIEEQAEEIDRLKGLVEVKQTTPLVAFVVRLKSVHYNCTNKLPFETIVLNEGNAFNTTTSYFRAPYAGLYSLTAQLCSHINNAFDFSVYSNTSKKAYGASRNGKINDHDCRSLSTVAKLVYGEEIFVRVDCPIGGEIEGHIDDKFWTMFSGVLLHLSP